jgi:hypothetical protein
LERERERERESERQTMGLTNNKGSKLQSTRKRKAAAQTNNNNWTRDSSLSVFVWEDSISKSWLCVRRIGEQEEEEAEGAAGAVTVPGGGSIGEQLE